MRKFARLFRLPANHDEIRLRQLWSGSRRDPQEIVDIDHVHLALLNSARTARGYQVRESMRALFHLDIGNFFRHAGFALKKHQEAGSRLRNIRARGVKVEKE